MTVHARLLGGFGLTIDGRAVDADDFERPSGLRLLKLLLVSPGHRIAREAAAELLWPELDPERSRVNLRKAVHFARQALEGTGAPALIGGGVTMLELDPAEPIDVDLDRLRFAIEGVLSARAAGRPPERATLQALADLGGVDLLPDEPYTEWLLPMRERLHRDAVEALLAGAQAARAAGNGGLALHLLARLLRLEPAEEAAHQLVIELHIEAGRVDAARRQLVACAAALADAYEVTPARELLAMIEAAPRAPSPAVASDRPEAGLGAVLVAALVEAISAVAGERPLTLAIGDVRLVREAGSLPGWLHA